MESDGAAFTLRARCELRFTRPVRTAVVACASGEGFSGERLGDVRLLADELFNAALAAGASEVVFQMTPQDGRLRLRVTADVPAAPPSTDMHYTHLLADVLAPGSHLSISHGQLSFHGTLSSDPT